jgi:hypothetical protein
MASPWIIRETFGFSKLRQKDAILVLPLKLGSRKTKSCTSFNTTTPRLRASPNRGPQVSLEEVMRCVRVAHSYRQNFDRTLPLTSAASLSPHVAASRTTSFQSGQNGHRLFRHPQRPSRFVTVITEAGTCRVWRASWRGLAS